MRYEVPQFIEVEQKVIGPFTWKQFVYLAGGACGALIVFLTLPFIVFVIIGLPIAALAAMLAFQKINDRPFELLLEAAFNYIVKSRFFLWNIDESRKYTIVGEVSAPQERRPIAPIQPRKEGGLAELQNKLVEDEVTTQ